MQAAMRTFVDEQELLQTSLISKNKNLSFVSEGSTDDEADRCSSETSSSLDLAEFTGPQIGDLTYQICTSKAWV